MVEKAQFLAYHAKRVRVVKLTKACVENRYTARLEPFLQFGTLLK
jgi:hypothetical protein